MKYRLKINGKITGALDNAGVLEHIRLGNVTRSSMIQVFPDGDWKNLASFDEFSTNFNDDRRDQTFLMNLNQIEEEAEEVEAVSEPENTIEKTIEKKEEPAQDFQEFVIEKIDKTIETKDDEKVKENVIETLSENENDVVDNDKTKINPDYQLYLEEKKAEEEALKKREEDKKKAQEKKIEETPDYENDATQFLNIKDLKKDVQDSIEIEELWEKEEQEKIKRKKDRKKKQKKEKKEILDEKVEGIDKKKLAVIAALFFAIFFLFDDEESSSKKDSLDTIKIVKPQILFPIQFDTIDKQKAALSYKKGLEELKKYKYTSFIKAGNAFHLSVKNSFYDNPAMADLILVYSELLKNSVNYHEDANRILRLVQIFSSKAYFVRDENEQISNDELKKRIRIATKFATAISYFYYSVDKINASLNVYDRYRIITGTKGSTNLLAVRLMALTKIGRFDEARNVVSSLEKISNKNFFVLRALYEFYKLQSNQEKMKSTLSLGRKSYPELVYFVIERGFNYIEEQNFDPLGKILTALNRVSVEGSRFYYSKFLILQGMFYASKKKIKTASKLFEKSLKLYESIDIIEKLALLNEATDPEVNSIIIKSKAKKQLRLAELDLENYELASAFKYALEASNIAPNDIEVRLFLARLQMKRGYIQDAIIKLEELYKKTPTSLDIMYTLVDAYTVAYKYKKATSLLNSTMNISTELSDEFYAAQAKLSLYKERYSSAAGYFKKAIKANPLNDRYAFELAKLYIRFKNFDKGKSILKKAMELDPSKIEYRIMFASIIYEVETSAAAIGYLYDVLKDFPDDPKILSEIGIYFYRSGQLKQYENIRKKLLGLPRKDISLYNFLIESARLEDNMSKVIEYSEKLIEFDPGNLRVRLNLATLYIDQLAERPSKVTLKKAQKQLKAIEVRLNTYPKLNYLNAKINFMVDNDEEAKRIILKEIEENPTIIDGYVLLGKIYQKQKDFQSAREQYTKALQRDPKAIEAILGIAYIAYISDRYDMALDQYEKAIEINPDRADIYKMLGDVNRKLGQSALAIKNYKQYLELSPNSSYKSKIETYIRTMQ